MSFWRNHRNPEESVCTIDRESLFFKISDTFMQVLHEFNKKCFSFTEANPAPKSTAMFMSNRKPRICKNYSIFLCFSQLLRPLNNVFGYSADEGRKWLLKFGTNWPQAEWTNSRVHNIFCLRLLVTCSISISKPFLVFKHFYQPCFGGKLLSIPRQVLLVAHDRIVLPSSFGVCFNFYFRLEFLLLYIFVDKEKQTTTHKNMIIRVYFEYCHELETNPFLAQI